MKTILCSGGFDPLHVGHLDLLDGASSYGHVIVVLNSDDWLMRKKGYVFMTWHDRWRILCALRPRLVANVLPSHGDKDDTVCEALRRIRPNYFANGGDRVVGDPREHAVCEDLGIEELFNVGGEKIRSSSILVDAVG